MINVTLMNKEDFECPSCEEYIDLVELLGEEGIGEVNFIDCPECEVKMRVLVPKGTEVSNV